MLQSFLDDTHLLILLMVTIVLMVAFIEIGFWLARHHHGKSKKPQMAQVRAIMGASLGLLAFMLAFSFSMAQRHFEVRTDAYLLEINAVESAYLGADLLGQQQKLTAKQLLRKFVMTRREAKKASDENNFKLVFEKIHEAELIHDQLWKIAESATRQEQDSTDASVFTNAVLAMVMAGDKRLQAKLFNRISPIVWTTLFLMALLSMMVMGFQAGLTSTHSRLATWVLAIMFSSVMMLVTDLDRPRTGLFKMNQQLMAELQEKMERS